MSDFKKLSCTPVSQTAYTDCDGAPLPNNASLVTCADFATIDPNKPTQPTEYCPSQRMSCAGQSGYCFGPNDTKDPAATVDLLDCDGNLVGSIYPTSAVGHTIEIKDCDAVIIGYAANFSECACPCDIPEATLVTITGTQATGNVIATVTLDGVPTDFKESITEVTELEFDSGTSTLSLTYRNETNVPVTKDVNIPVKVAVEHIAPIIINPANTYLNYSNQIVVDANGNFYGFNAAGQPTKLNITETVTRFKDTKLTGNPIGTYENEQIADFVLRETITTLKSLEYNKATSKLTAVYTDETGNDIIKEATLVAQATAFINGINPASATIFSLETPPTVNDNTLKQNPDYVFVGTDGSYWFWNGTAYVTAPTPAATTEWNIAGTSVDAKGDKVGMIARTGWVSIGKNGVPGMALDVERSGTDAYLPIARFLAPANAIVGNRTQLIYGISQNPLNAADFRFFYAGNGSTSNRIDFAFSNVVLPNVSLLGTGWVGITQTAPVSAFANTATEIRGTNSVGAYSGGFNWSATGTGFAGSFYSQPGTGHGLQVKGLGTAVTNNLLEVSTGTQNGTATPILNVWGNGRVGVNSPNNGILGGVGTLSRFDVNGSFGFNIRGSGASTSQGADDGTVVLTSAGTTYTLEAPSATVNARRLIAVKNNSTGNITVSGHIDGVAGVNQIIPSQGGAIYHSNGTSWYRIADNIPAVHAISSARINRGIDVTLDNLKFRVSASGNASLQVSTVTGTVTVWGTSSSNFETNASVSTLAVTTTPVYLRPALNLPNAGDIQRFLFVTSDNRSYEVRLCISPGYTSNLVHIERLA
jgi:hypothetical protein